MHDSTFEFNDLIQKSCKELGISWINNNPSHCEYLFKIVQNFDILFPEITITNPYIILLRSMTYVAYSNNVIMSATQIYDTFVIFYKFLKNKFNNVKDVAAHINSKTIDNLILDICSDILNNYEGFDPKVKSQIPILLVDILCILFLRLDSYGKRVSLFQLKSYYQTKKLSLLNGAFSYPSINMDFVDATIDSSDITSAIATNAIHISDSVSNSSIPVSSDYTTSPHPQISSNSTITNSSITKISETDETLQKKSFSEYQKQSPPSTVVVALDDIIVDDMSSKISQIVKREKNEIHRLLSNLPQKEQIKLYDICNNYNKILNYSKFENLQDFKLEIERELGRSLSDKQIRHSQISIKKVQFYIENILDGKFEPHLTHGINHVKHNFEYGYRLVGLINNSRSRNKTIKQNEE